MDTRFLLLTPVVFLVRQLWLFASIVLLPLSVKLVSLAILLMELLVFLVQSGASTVSMLPSARTVLPRTFLCLMAHV